MQDLKDFARQSGLDVVYSEVNRDRDPQGGGKGYVFSLYQINTNDANIMVNKF